MKDYLQDSNQDLLIKQGDFVKASSTAQHIGLILASHKGDWKMAPWVGVNLREWINDDGSVTALKHTIQSQLELDGARVHKLEIIHGTIQVDATYDEQD